MSQWITQFRKGIVEYAILLHLSTQEDYALNIVRCLNQHPCFQVSESTVYPILGRLKKEGKLSSKIVPSSEGPPRRYLSLSKAGKLQLKQMKRTLSEMNQAITTIENNNQKDEL